MKKIIAAILALVMLLSLASCGETKENAGESDTTAECYNGNFVGSYEEETGVLSFKGIPYAKAPTGERRWKAPEPVDASDETVNADSFGKSSIQYYWFSEDITTDVSEDCLTLNVWTKDLSGENKPVMVFFHGGSYAWGGSSEPLYNGQYIVNEHEDVIVVTCNYRIGIMGFIDFSSVPGGEEYSDSIQLGLLDALESLRWIKNNIASFGGDPDNVTIFGESAGSGIVSCLLASEYAGELFQRAIAESGALNQTNSREEAAENNQAEILMQLAGAENMDDLMALTEEELIELNEYPLDEYETCLNDMYSIPFTGGIVPADPYAAIANAKAKGVDLLIGTNKDEANYWITEMGGDEIQNLSDEEIEECISDYGEYFIDPMFERMLDKLSEEGKADIYEYMALHSDLDELWQKSMVISEYMFRAASIRMAECYSESSGSGRTYMYLFEKTHSDYDCMGACHASELSYVFHNLNYNGFSGATDEALADKVCSAWVNFAKTGNPSTEDVEWTQYDTAERNTMVMGDDCTMKMVSDPMGAERELAACLGYINLSGGNGI